MGEESVGGRWPERRQSFSFFPDSIRALWVIASKADVSSGTRQRGKLSRKVKPPPQRASAKTENRKLSFRFIKIRVCLDQHLRLMESKEESANLPCGMRELPLQRMTWGYHVAPSEGKRGSGI